METVATTITLTLIIFTTSCQGSTIRRQNLCKLCGGGILDGADGGPPSGLIEGVPFSKLVGTAAGSDFPGGRIAGGLLGGCGPLGHPSPYTPCTQGRCGTVLQQRAAGCYTPLGGVPTGSGAGLLSGGVGGVGVRGVTKNVVWKENVCKLCGAGILDGAEGGPREGLGAGPLGVPGVGLTKTFGEGLGTGTLGVLSGGLLGGCGALGTPYSLAPCVQGRCGTVLQQQAAGCYVPIGERPDPVAAAAAAAAAAAEKDGVDFVDAVPKAIEDRENMFVDGVVKGILDRKNICKLCAAGILNGADGGPPEGLGSGALGTAGVGLTNTFGAGLGVGTVGVLGGGLLGGCGSLGIPSHYTACAQGRCGAILQQRAAGCYVPIGGRPPAPAGLDMIESSSGTGQDGGVCSTCVNGSTCESGVCTRVRGGPLRCGQKRAQIEKKCVPLQATGGRGLGVFRQLPGFSGFGGLSRACLRRCGGECSAARGGLKPECLRECVASC